MIVRDIAKDPSIADRFDYFNDYMDTLAWLYVHLGLYPEDQVAKEALRKLRAGHQDYENSKRTTSK